MKIITKLNSIISDMNQLFLDGDILSDGYIEFTEHHVRVCIGSVGGDQNTINSSNLTKILNLNSSDQHRTPEDIIAYRLLYELFKKQYFELTDFAPIVANQEFTSFYSKKRSQNFIGVAKKIYENSHPKVFALLLNELFSESHLYPSKWMHDIQSFSTIILNRTIQEYRSSEPLLQNLAFEFFSEPSRFIQLLQLKDAMHNDSKILQNTTLSLLSHIDRKTLRTTFMEKPHQPPKYIAL